jgi:multimeric flavodoxin WrbA
MKKQSKILFISGSPRKGNTDFVLEQAHKAIDSGNKEMVYLRNENIGFCKGCLFCHKKPKCALKDDMGKILAKMIEADVLVLGSPNYFDNVNGLMKNFMDRCHPLYEKELIRKKKIILVFVGGGEARGTKKCLELAFFGFVKYLKLDMIDSFSFQALERNDLKKKGIAKEIKRIVGKINSL